jgi:peroxiredoxin
MKELRRTTKIFLLLTLLLVLVACAAPDSGTTGAGTPGTATPAAESDGSANVGLAVGQEAPDFTALLLEGGVVTLSDLRGKPVFLNIFTTWCPPCQTEIPDIDTVFTELGEDVNVIGISVGEAKDVLDSYFAEKKVSYPVAYDQAGEIAATYNIDVIPQSWVIDANGVIIDYIVGGTDANTIRTALEVALDSYE